MKFTGEIGFWVEDIETAPGVYAPKIEEKHYNGDLLRNYRKNQASTSKQNADLTVNNQIQIYSDMYALQNLSSIRYVRWLGQLWEVSDVQLEHPRLLIDLGGVYSGPIAD